MENSSYDNVVDFIAKEFKIKKSKLNLESSLMSDIGLDGDDVLDFLLKFFKEFDIEYEQTNYLDFIPPERGGGLGTLLLFLLFPLFLLFSKFSKNKKRKIDNNEIFVKDLVISLDKKKWQKEMSQYATV